MTPGKPGGIFLSALQGGLIVGLSHHEPSWVVRAAPLRHPAHGCTSLPPLRATLRLIWDVVSAGPNSSHGEYGKTSQDSPFDVGTTEKKCGGWRSKSAAPVARLAINLLLRKE